MKHSTWSLILGALSILFVGCTESEDASKDDEQATFFEFEIALRHESLEEEPSPNVGIFSVVSRHEIPVNIGGDPKEISSIEKGIWVDIRWSKSEMQAGRLWLRDFQYRIRNKMLYAGSGGAKGWTSGSTLAVSKDWQHLNTRIDLSSYKKGPVLYHRIRWLNPSPAIPEIEMAEIAQELNAESYVL